ncbi:MAG: hypothetical protein JJE25_07800 [Bacteroidia bacterium]|nr:hypothetical protein [Bacteroidia bacterium]
MAYKPVHIIRNAHLFTKADVYLNVMQINIIYWMADNLSEDGIGEKVFRSARCVNTHVGNIYRETGCCTHGGLVSYAHKYKVIFHRKGVLMKTKGNIKPEKKK